MLNNGPDAGILEKMKGYNEKLSISQAVIFFERHGYSITKTMIQNYIRVSVLPPPFEKRRYTKNHLLMVILIDHLKSIYSLDEIRKLFGPLTNDPSFYSDLDMSGIYKKFCGYYENKAAELKDRTAANGSYSFDISLSVAAESVACKNYAANSNR